MGRLVIWANPFGMKDVDWGSCYPTLNTKCAFRMGTHCLWWVKDPRSNCRSLGSAYPNHGVRDWGPERAPLGMTLP
jgi:hypothetical protein